jgi:hypothetical protein
MKRPEFPHTHNGSLNVLTQIKFKERLQKYVAKICMDFTS